MPSKKDSDPEKWDCPPHTKAKHEILSRYLNGWYPVLTKMNGRVLVLDGYAGRGRYTSGDLGSPVIAVEKLLYHSYFPQMKDREFVFIFVEHNEDNCTSLKKELEQVEERWVEANAKSFPKNVTITVQNDQFQNAVDSILLELQKQKASLAPTFAFIDPFGYSGMPMKTIKELLEFDKCEIFVTFMVDHVNRFLEQDGQGANMSELFGRDVPSVLKGFNGGKRVEHLRDIYKEQLHDFAGFDHVQWFAMKRADGHVGYYLFHGTRHVKGVELMKSAMWSAQPDGSYTFEDRFAGTDVLFQPAPDLRPLRDGLVARFTGKQTTCGDARKWVMLETPFMYTHLTQVLRALEKETPHVMSVSRPHPKAQFRPDVLLTFS